MALGRENIPASQPQEGTFWGEGVPWPWALEQRLADGLAAMGCDDLR